MFCPLIKYCMQCCSLYVKEVFFIQEGQRMQRKDIDLTTHTQKKYGDIHVIIIPLLLVMSLELLRRLHAQFQTTPSSFLKPDKCFSFFLVASYHTKSHIGLREYSVPHHNLNIMLIDSQI